MKTYVLPLLLSVLATGAAIAQESGESPRDHVRAQHAQDIPWPPEERSFEAPGNWPITHPAPAVDIHALPAAVVFRSLSDLERKSIQRRMAEVGYYGGRIDGAWGPLTWEGVKQYANRVGIGERLSSTSGSLMVFQHIAS